MADDQIESTKPDEILYVDSWQYGIRDGLFTIGFGIKTEPGQVKIFKTFIMNPNAAKKMYSHLGNFLSQDKNPDEPPKRNLPS